MLIRHAAIVATLAVYILAAHAQQPLLDRIPPNGQSLRVDRSGDLPATFVAALKRTDCRHDDTMLFTFPIELFRPGAGSRPMMIVPCTGNVLSGRAFLLD